MSYVEGVEYSTLEISGCTEFHIREFIRYFYQFLFFRLRTTVSQPVET